MKRRKSSTKNRSTKKVDTSFNEDVALLESAKLAGSKAIRSSRALGITITVIQDHHIVSINPDKSRKVLRKISKPKIDISLLKKGMVLDRKKHA